MPLRCVDASFVVAALVPGYGSGVVEEAWSDYVAGEDTFVAPPLLYPETISAVRRLAHRGLLTEGESSDIVEDFLALEIPTPQPRGLYRHAFSLAVRYRQPRVYDACYLALAEQLSCQLLTLDERLYNSVARDSRLIRLVV